MPARKLDNYLRAHRKRAGLSQREVAFLLGLKCKGPVSELEKRRRTPLLRTALTLEAVFGAPADELFAGMCDCTEAQVRKRLQRLEAELRTKVDKKCDVYKTARKLAWIAKRLATLNERQPETGAGA